MTKVKFQSNKNSLKLIEETAKKNALLKTVIWIEGELNAMGVIPHDSGDMQQSMGTEIEDFIARVTISGLQVRRLYFHPEYNFRKDKNPNAQGRWMDTFIFGERSKDVIEKYKEYYQEELGGLLK